MRRLSRRAWLGYGFGVVRVRVRVCGSRGGREACAVRCLAAPRCARAPRSNGRRCTARRSRSVARRWPEHLPAARPPQIGERTWLEPRAVLVGRGRRAAAPQRGGARCPQVRWRGWHTRAAGLSIGPIAGWAGPQGHAWCRRPYNDHTIVEEPVVCMVCTAYSSFAQNPLTTIAVCEYPVHDCFFARGVSRVRASCSVPRLRVRALVSHNENLNSPKQSFVDACRACKQQ